MTQAVNIIISNLDGEYLLQMRDGSVNIRDPLKWGFFGGGIESGESPLQAAQREIREELDLSVPLELFKELGSVAVREDKVVYAIRLKQAVAWGDFTPLEGAGAAFFAVEELSRIELSQTGRGVIERFVLKS